MNKLFRYICLLIATFWLLACTPDALPTSGPEPSYPPDGGDVQVVVELGVAGMPDGGDSRVSGTSHTGSSSRSSADPRQGDYSDTHMVAGELMRNWLVVICDKENRIIDMVKNGAYEDAETERSQDQFWERMTPGTYVFYSFANIQASELGLADKQKGDMLPSGYFEEQKYSVKIPSLTFADHWSDFSLDYFPQGIPMSNKQVINITHNTQSIQLEVVRMVAKMTLSLTNVTSHDITLKGLTLSDMTPSTIDDNLMLLPTADATDAEGNVHVSAPNLAITEEQKQVSVYTPLNTSDSEGGLGSSSSQGYVILKNGGKMNICFYVNESEAAAENKYFVLQLLTSDGVITTSGGQSSATGVADEEVNHRYAMLNWRQICRNDYRVIPISLDDYAIQWKVEAFSSIGVLPKVEDDGENLTITFGNYGEFHMIPSVKQLSTGKTVDSWNVSNCKCEEVVSTPSGINSIFDVAPTWVTSANRIEGEMGNRSGTAIYRVSMQVKKPDDTQITLTRKVRFVMNEVHF